MLIECDASRTGLEPLIAAKYMMYVLSLQIVARYLAWNLQNSILYIFAEVQVPCSHVENLASMKRIDALVSYSSSDDSDTESQPAPPLKKKYANSPYTVTQCSFPARKLPVLSTSLQPPTPVDNPALHQGRTRTSPHVEGQFAAYVYVPVFVDARSALGKLLNEVASHAKEITPELWDVGFLDNHEEGDVDVEGNRKRRRTTGERELHVSLSRPTYLRAHQRDELKRAVKALAKNHTPYVLYLTPFLTFILSAALFLSCMAQVQSVLCDFLRVNE
jgi:Uncharacterised conserved protein